MLCRLGFRAVQWQKWLGCAVPRALQCGAALRWVGCCPFSSAVQGQMSVGAAPTTVPCSQLWGGCLLGPRAVREGLSCWRWMRAHTLFSGCRAPGFNALYRAAKAAGPTLLRDFSITLVQTSSHGGVHGLPRESFSGLGVHGFWAHCSRFPYAGAARARERGRPFASGPVRGRLQGAQCKCPVSGTPVGRALCRRSRAGSMPQVL